MLFVRPTIRRSAALGIVPDYVIILNQPPKSIPTATPNRNLPSARPALFAGRKGQIRCRRGLGENSQDR
jgi:hypothetical protein